MPDFKGFNNDLKKYSTPALKALLSGEEDGFVRVVWETRLYFESKDVREELRLRGVRLKEERNE